MSGLSDLLQRLNTEGWSSRRIERETEKHGRRISYATVSRYLNGTHPQNPDSETLQAFADVFSVDVNELRTALGKPGVGEAFDLGPEASRLTGPQREAIRTTVRLFVEQNDALARDAVEDGPTTSRLSVVPGKLPSSEREELYRRAEQIDLDAEPHAAARSEDTSDDDESV